MTNSKIPTMRKEALIEGPILLVIYFIFLLSVFHKIQLMFGAKGGEPPFAPFDLYNPYIPFGLYIIVFLIPLMLSYTSYFICKSCNFIYSDIKTFPFKDMLFVFSFAIILFISTLWYSGISNIDDFGKIISKKSLLCLAFCFSISKVNCAWTYKRKMNPSQQLKNKE